MILSIVFIFWAFSFFRHFQARWRPFGATAKIVQSARPYLHTYSWTVLHKILCWRILQGVLKPFQFWFKNRTQRTLYMKTCRRVCTHHATQKLSVTGFRRDWKVVCSSLLMLWSKMRLWILRCVIPVVLSQYYSIYNYMYIHIHAVKNTTIFQMISLCTKQHYVIYNYMFRSCKWAIIRLFV